MYFIIRDRNPSPLAGLSPAERKAATDAWDKAQSMKLTDAAAERREQLEALRAQARPAARAAAQRSERGLPLSHRTPRPNAPKC